MQLVVGRIGRAHGVRGDLFVEPFTDEPEIRFAPGKQLQTSQNKSLTVAESKWHSGRLILHFVGIDDRNTAEQLKGTELVAEVDPLELPEDPDEFYDHQLVGLTVLLAGEDFGKVSQVIHLPAQDLLSVTRVNGSEVLIPFVKQIVPVVDIRNGQLQITPPPGLVDEEQAIEVRGEQ
jgi:16S rRNA processing protein RimM